MGLFSAIFGSDTPKDKIEYHKKCIERLKSEIETCKRNMSYNRLSAAQKMAYKRNIDSYKKRIAEHKDKIADLRKQK